MGTRDYRKGGLPFQFQVIPKDVLAMDQFHSLPAGAKALMLDLVAQYTGKNNGRLTTNFDAMQRAGWTSKSTLMRAKLALFEMPFAIMTRKGHAPRTAEWMGFTWWKLDWDKTMDLDPREFPHLNFMRTAQDPNVGRHLASKNKIVVPFRDQLGANAAARHLESGLMESDLARRSVPKRDHFPSEELRSAIGLDSRGVIDVAISGAACAASSASSQANPAHATTTDDAKRLRWPLTKRAAS
jgi:hypothetical protein